MIELVILHALRRERIRRAPFLLDPYLPLLPQATGRPIAFKIKTTNPKRYLVSPRRSLPCHGLRRSPRVPPAGRCLRTIWLLLTPSSDAWRSFTACCRCVQMRESFGQKVPRQSLCRFPRKK
eukprot:scaffold187559_cov30-Tisochrysis_lutea.AAC.1